jgi:uncharacterized protein
MRTPFHPGLYDPNDEPPALHGIRCARCANAFFPPFGIGCEVCGAPAEALQPELLTAAGVVHSVATVHHHAGKGIAAPFTMAEIRLDDGPLIRATLSDLADPATIGARAQGCWIVVVTTDSGDELTELRFEVAAS